MVAYLVALQIHRTAVVLTAVLFITRWIWTLQRSPSLQRRWVKVVPHVNDTILLAAAFYMVSFVGAQSWILAKVTGLLTYIVLGAVALRPGMPLRLRIIAFAAAIATFAYIVAVALTKRVIPWGG